MDEAETELRKKLEELDLPEGVQDPDMSRNVYVLIPCSQLFNF